MKRYFRLSLSLLMMLALALGLLAGCKSAAGEEPTAAEQPSQDAQGKQTGEVKETSGEQADKPAEQKKDKPAQDKPTQDKPAQDKPAQDKPAQDKEDAKTAPAPEQGGENAAAEPSEGSRVVRIGDFELVLDNGFSAETVAMAHEYAEQYSVSYDYSGAKTDLTLTFNDDGTYAFAQENKIYCKDLKLTIEAPKGATVYYSLDGIDPDAGDTRYVGPITFKARGSSFPDAYTFRAVAVYADGSSSRVAARTYLTGTKLNGRFSTLIVSVSGDPTELTEGPNGILYGDNAELRGREYERAVHIDAWSADGDSVLDQYAGVRAYGGYSRKAPLKSLKLFSRKSYDADNKNFKLKVFRTPRLDDPEKIIKSYDKLVLRNCGNDLQFSYIRDELSQTLCKIAGFECYEEVVPVVIYLNGKYYNYAWLHENYCDKYLHEKYGEDAPGEFFIIEGGDTEKLPDDDPETQKLVDEYNAAYNRFITMDMTDDDSYRQLTEFMDVESYLDFFAWNIAINNWDWPNNNYKCFKYVPSKKDTYTEGVFDGRWRFLVHDMDYTYGLYDQDKAMANYNTLRVVLKPNHDTVRYSPLFALLMERADCREYFRNKTFEYLDGPLSADCIKTAYYLLHATRKQELSYYYDFLKRLSQMGNFDIWSQEGHYDNYERQIMTFAEQRGSYVRKYMEELLPSLK